MNRRYMALEAWEWRALSAYARAKGADAAGRMASAWEAERSAYHALWLLRASLTAASHAADSRPSHAGALRRLLSSASACPIEARLCALFAD